MRSNLSLLSRCRRDFNNTVQKVLSFLYDNKTQIKELGFRIESLTIYAFLQLLQKKYNIEEILMHAIDDINN